MTAIAILAAVAMPRFGATFARLETERRASDVAQLLRVGQAAAVATARTVECRYDDSERQFVLQQPALPASPGVAAQDAVVLRRSRVLPAEARVELLTPSSITGLFFYPNGTSSGTTVVLTISTHVYHLEIDSITAVVTLHAGLPAAARR